MTSTDHNRAEEWTEYESLALYCAQRGMAGTCGTVLPANISHHAMQQINRDVDAFAERVRANAYMLAMESHSLAADGGHDR